MHVRHALRVLVTAGALAGLALPAAANAETFKHSDPTKDVQGFDDTSGATAQPTNKTADISHLTVRHTSQRLTVTVKLRDLAKTWYVVSELETPDGLTGSRDKTKHTITFVTPTSCLSSPRWSRRASAWSSDRRRCTPTTPCAPAEPRTRATSP